MKILVLNSGSSSLKYQLIDMETKTVLCKGNYERIGETEAFLTHKVGGEKEVIKHYAASHDEALQVIFEQLLSSKYNIIKSLDEISAVGHRIVHGGDLFNASAVVNEDVISKIEQCASFAPLHNPAAVQGIRACQKLMPNTFMVTVFDTAFHQTMPKESYIYPIPYEYYTKYKVRKYGAHGTSHDYVSKRLANILGVSRETLKIVTCHLGQGASISAIENGMCVDTSMGLTPLGGIPMVTRSGDLDPSVVTYVMEKENISASEMNSILNRKAGLAAVCNMAPDFRYIEQESYTNDDAKLVTEMFCTKVAEYIARYAAKMSGIDAIVFTGGIGENQINVRKRICEHLGFLNIKINEENNNTKGEEIEISTTESKVKIYVIPTDEEMVIAEDTLKLLLEEK